MPVKGFWLCGRLELGCNWVKCQAEFRAWLDRENVYCHRDTYDLALGFGTGPAGRVDIPTQCGADATPGIRNPRARWLGRFQCARLCRIATDGAGPCRLDRRDNASLTFWPWPYRISMSGDVTPLDATAHLSMA